VASGMMLLSVVIPVYGCQGCLEELCRRLFAVAKTLPTPSLGSEGASTNTNGRHVEMEIILVDDASPDEAWTRIKELASIDHRIKGIRLARNFGQHFAISAGIDHAQGDYVAVMDCDLQDIPEELPKLWAKSIAGEEVVFGRRYDRKDSGFKRLGSWAFYQVMSALAGTTIDGAAANYSIVSKSVAEGYRRMKERHRSYGLLIHWLRPRVAFVDIEHAPRTEGKSGYTLGRQLRLAADIIVSFSTRPLVYSVFVGFGFTVLAMTYVAYLVFRYFWWGMPVAGWASTIVSVWFLGGLILANLGIMGLYLGKVFEQSKERPLYFVGERTESVELAPSQSRSRDSLLSGD
jgi:glycosyltransferase involved in cell wall biosynthesis